MISVQAGGDIARPAPEVFGFVSDFANNPRWQQGMRSCVWTSDPPLRVGSTYDQVAHFLGRDVVSSFEVVEYEPGRRIRITTTASSFPLTITRGVDPTGPGSCRVWAVIEGDASGFYRLAAPALRALVQRSVRRDYARLKTLLESQPQPA